jgi:hypothetical protein
MATLYFNGAVNSNWNTLGNWWIDSSFSNPSYSLPTIADDVYIKANCDSNSGGSIAVNSLYVGDPVIYQIGLYNITVSVETTATFEQNYDNNATIYGDVILLFGGHVGTINGNVTLDGDSTLGSTAIVNTPVNGNVTVNAGINYGTINGNAIFNYNTWNAGTVTGSATFDGGINGNYNVSPAEPGTVNGNASFINNGYNFYGTIGGTVMWSGYTGTNSYGTFSGGQKTIYYNNSAADGDWANISNWYTDNYYGTNSPVLPLGDDHVILEASCTTNSGSTPTVNHLTMNDPSSNAWVFGINIVVNGMAQFNGSSRNEGNITGDVTFNYSSEFVSGTITGNASFYGTSVFNTGTVTGNVTVYYDHPLPFTYGGTINGSLLYSGYSPRTVYFYHTGSSEDWGGSFWYTASAGGGSSTYAPNSAISKDDVLVEASIGSNTGNLDTTIKDLTVSGVSNPFINVDITCDSALFMNFSYLNTGATLTQPSGVAGYITFSDSSNNQGTINNYNPVIFQSTSSNDGTINGDADVYYPSEKPVGGTVTGFVTYYGYTLYFGGPMNDGNWSNTANWYLDFANASGYGAVPSEIMPYQNVIVQSNITSNTSSNPSVYDISTTGSYPYISIAILVTNLATLSDETYLDSTAVVSGNALFQNLATNRGGTITGTGTFTLSSAETMISNGYDGTYGDIEFQYGKGVNGSSILGII